MSFSRRQFLKRSSATLVAASIPVSFARAHHAEMLTHGAEAAACADDPATRALLDRAIDTARNAGASYADARYLTVTYENWGFDGNLDLPAGGVYVRQGIGVRALYNGYWGYAALAHAELTADAVAQLGREATAEAKTGAKGKPRTVELTPAPVVTNGRWVTPITIDPFTVSWDEKIDVMNGFGRYVGLQPFGTGTMSGMRFTRDAQAFVSTEGSSFVQTLYRTKMQFFVGLGNWRTGKLGGRNGDSIVNVAGAGWEYVLNAPIEAHAERLIAQARAKTEAVPVDVGRYDIVFDGAALAKIADVNLQAATELDRAMTYVANSAGTSYLSDPLGMVGTYRLGSSLLNVKANRSMPRGAATVQWDDEGVSPDEATLVKDGVLKDFQTTRESASWLAAYYRQRGLPVRSHGGAVGSEIGDAPTQGAHNLVIESSSSDTSIEALCAGVKKGLMVFSGSARADQQALNAESSGDLVYEIKNGKLGRVVEGAVILTRAPEFWKNLAALGGRSTTCDMGFETTRAGSQPTPHTVSAPAALVTQVAVTADVTRTL